MTDLQQDVGQMVLAGFEGTTLPDTVQQALQRQEVSGLILFKRNLTSIEQIGALTQAIHNAAPEPVFVGIDQEGGRVQRIKDPLTVWPPMRKIGDMEDAHFVSKVGEALSDEIAWLGFNLNFAPVVDIHTNADNTVIGDRAFATTPKLVSRYAGAFLGGMAISGVMPCAKHFPGHGDTSTDSHLELPVLDLPIATLQERELKPFEAMIQAKVPMIMTAHILFPALDDTYPATLSPKILSELLRLKLGYNGIVVTDDLNMKALADHHSIQEIAERGLEAGVDLFLICQHEDRRVALYEALLHLGERNSMHRSRIAQAAARIRAGKKAWLRPYQPTSPLLDHDALRNHQELLQKYGLHTTKDEPIS